MHFIKYLFLLILFFMLSLQSYAQRQPKVLTDTLEVTGVCKMCKARIEKAAMYVRGVKFAEWQAETQGLKVVYKTKKTNPEQICAAVALAGHDNELLKSTEEAYEKLPGCCKYRDGVKVH
ncbi:MAG: cation transporter [Bacteroidota bacterium]